jgi:hypothetical protein
MTVDAGVARTAVTWVPSWHLWVGMALAARVRVSAEEDGRGSGFPCSTIGRAQRRERRLPPAGRLARGAVRRQRAHTGAWQAMPLRA